MTDEASAQPVDENHLIAERRAKLAALRGQGIAFPNDFRRADYAQDLQDAYADAERWTGEALEGEGRRVALAGRLMAKRVMGKAGVRADPGRVGAHPAVPAVDRAGRHLRRVQGLGRRRHRRRRGHADAHEDRRAVGQGRHAAPADQVAAAAAGQVARPERRRAALSPALRRPDRDAGSARRVRAALAHHRARCVAGSMRGASWKSRRR